MKNTVGAIIIKDNKILLAKRGHPPFKNYRTLPGGHIEKGETAKQAIIREVKEEANLDIKPIFFMDFIEIFERIRWYACVTIFTGKANGNIMFDNHEIKDVRYFSFNKLPKLAFNHEEIIKRYRKSKMKRLINSTLHI